MAEKLEGFKWNIKEKNPNREKWCINLRAKNWLIAEHKENKMSTQMDLYVYLAA